MQLLIPPMHTSHETLTHQGREALSSGDTAAARRLLTQAVTIAPQSAAAWLWLSGAVPTDAERRFCLTQLLTIDPTHTAALRGIVRLAEGPLLDPRLADVPLKAAAPASAAAEPFQTLPLENPYLTHVFVGREREQLARLAPALDQLSETVAVGAADGRRLGLPPAIADRPADPQPSDAGSGTQPIAWRAARALIWRRWQPYGGPALLAALLVLGCAVAAISLVGLLRGDAADAIGGVAMVFLGGLLLAGVTGYLLIGAPQLSHRSRPPSAEGAPQE